MASGDIKGFYRQKKKQQKGGITKSVSASASKKKKPSKSGGSATLGATDPQTPVLFAHGAFDLTDDYGEDEERLRQFDMDMRYGPCIGLTRLQRWERASSMGLQPPADLRNLLSRASGPKSPDLECLWEGRV
ncbi:DNA polymerase delta, subunit 4 [Musa troglodytarum]|uniref:DNA polymerase delta, subunit 4 n=1 Tax=Musa troglodytarum TaxID=320322 RepID=A0A9E7KAH1_9LILI|nr:DNA polymerase delta, subunit 4 [Musa troglodytarum]URE10432.1 DNA polymerase delta, subunit 4 [Musa troglodytarum]URE10433.1 DNA polymerase delta, subunit 4 [Musa troglodytarum]URE10434.1 DNA polymerase delta, subunit 4 [Musa troglodytarum]